MAILTGPKSFFAGGPTSKRSTTAEESLGTKAYTDDGNEYTYCKAGAAIAVNDACIFTGSALGWDSVIPSAAAEQVAVGVADTAFASADYGWLLTRGRVTCKTVNGIAAGSSLSTNATAGTLKISVTGDLAPGVGVALVTGVTAGSAIYFRG
jgi:hypothetical protein